MKKQLYDVVGQPINVGDVVVGEGRGSYFNQPTIVTAIDMDKVLPVEGAIPRMRYNEQGPKKYYVGRCSALKKRTLVKIRPEQIEWMGTYYERPEHPTPQQLQEFNDLKMLLMKTIDQVMNGEFKFK